MIRTLYFFSLNFLLLASTASACGIGVPRIEKGKWANKDSIYANCENCYAGDEEEIRNCKAMYNRTAEGQIIEIEQQRKQALAELPKLIKEMKQTDFTPTELCYFPKKYHSCENSKDTLNVVMTLNKSDLFDFDTKLILKYQNFLISLKERKKDFVQFQNLLRARPKKLKANEIKLSIMSMIPFERIEDRIVNVDHWLYLFGKYSEFVEGCSEYEMFKQLAESNSLLNCIFISQKEYGQHNRVFSGGSDFSDVSYESVKNGIEACLKLKGEEEKIAYENDFIYEQSVGNTVWALTRLYEKEVLGAITDKEKKSKEDEFQSQLGIEYIRPIIDKMVKYKRHERRKLNLGTQTGERYLQLKRIYNL